MFKINETATGYDLAELLHGESGIFEACSPSGEKFQVVTRAGHSIANMRPYPADSKQGPQTRSWRVRKIGELRLEQETVV
jgi:hypothetical protein